MDCSLQVGDMGIFFEKNLAEVKDLGPNHKWFRGNHDNPSLCKLHPQYLGDYGYRSKPDLFWTAGGWSIDKDWRTPGLDWWPEEELAYTELLQAVELFKDSKPRIMVSHECPASAKWHLISLFPGKEVPPSRTATALEAMLQVHKPEYWVFGHWHQKKVFEHEDVTFICLGEFLQGKVGPCIHEIPGVKW